MNAMKAWTSSDHARRTMRWRRRPGAGRQYVVEVEAAGLNFLDALMLRGLYQTKPPLPFTPGVEAVGRIVAAGDGRAAAGRHARRRQRAGRLCRAHAWWRPKAADAIPDDIPAAEAVSLFGVVYGTAWHALHNRAALQPGETVLVHAAAGGVGSATVQLAAAHGCRVLATAGGPAKAAIARAWGPSWRSITRTAIGSRPSAAHTRGRGADVIFDPVGGEVGERSLRCLAWHGRYLVVGFAAGPIPALAANRFLLKEASAVGVFWGAADAADPALRARVHAALLALYREGKAKPVVRGTFPLGEAEAALASLAGRASVGKVVLTVGAG